MFVLPVLPDFTIMNKASSVFMLVITNLPASSWQQLRCGNTLFMNSVSGPDLPLYGGAADERMLTCANCKR